LAAAISFNQPPEKAVAFFKGKGLQASFAWQDMLHEEHDHAFTVAKMMDLDLLADVKALVDRAISEGRTLREFIADLKPELQRRGWWGRQMMTDPATGEAREVQLGSSRRLKIIYDVNLRTSYAAGHWAAIEQTKRSAPYVMYSAILDGRTRPQHAAWNGKVLRADDAWWKTHTPPNGWNCRCTVIQLGPRDLKALGKDGPDPAPQDGMRDWTNPRTGEIVKVPAGVDPGFGYAPGATRREALAATAMEKIAAAPADLGAAFWRGTRDKIVADIASHFEQFVDKAVEAGKATRSRAIVGAIGESELAFLAARGVTPASAEIAVSDQLIIGAKSQRYAAKGVELTVEEWKALPANLAGERQALWDTENNTLIYLWASLTDPRRVRVAVRPDFKARGEKLNDIRSAQKINVADIQAAIKGGRYVVVDK